MRRCDLARETLMAKGREYSSETDRLHNFKRAGRVMNCTPEKALLGFLTKHLVSIFDMVDALDKGAPIDPKMKEEKLGDVCAYVILLDALFEERISEQENESHSKIVRVETPGVNTSK